MSDPLAADMAATLAGFRLDLDPGTLPRMDRRERARVAADCLEIAERGAAIARGGFRSRPDVQLKSAHDVLTAFDLASQVCILELLAERYPGVPVIAEESEHADESQAPPRGLSFAVDPIDGTTNFAHGHPVWCVSVGALFDGAPVAGAIVAPCLGARWHGFVDGGGGGVALYNGTACRVSSTATLSSALVGTGFPPERDLGPANNFDSFIAVKRLVRGVRRCGAAAIDIAFVADGTYDGYWERRLRIWDAAAGAALVLAAGGRITDLTLGPPRYEAGHLCVSNGLVHDALARAIAGG